MFDTTEELLKQIRLGEDSSLELKDLRYKGLQVNAPHRHSIADEFAAMANSFSGVFVFGVDDTSRTIVGIPEEKLDIVETWIRNICNDLITPQLECRIRKLPVIADEGLERVVIRVDISKSLYVHQSPGGYFQRIGSSKRQMTPDILARLFQQRSQARIIRFDEQAVNEAPVGCLDKRIWEKYRTPLSPASDSEFLQKLKLLTQNDEGEICPSVGGLLMACADPDEFLSNAFIQAVVYRGAERNAAYQVDAKDIKGPLDVQIADAYAFVKKNMNVYAVKDPARRDIPQYAMEAVFEALVNAVAHRDYSIQASKIRLHMYSDRLEIFSPGTIPNTMTIESLPLRQANRNELLTSLLARCPLSHDLSAPHRQFIMDRRGEGVPIILSNSKHLSGRLPEYRLIDDTELQLTIFAAPDPRGRAEDDYS